MSSRTDWVAVEQSRPKERLDVFLRSIFPSVSRGTIQRLIEQGHIRVSGQQVKPTHHPRAGEKIQVTWPEARPAELQAEKIPLFIIYEDNDLLVLNKPPGMVVHPSSGHEAHTLVHALLHHCRGKLSGIGGVARPGIVHRLDKETSGCLAVAKTDAAHLRISDQFARREVEKIYHALLCGTINPSSGEIDAAIGRHPTHRKRMTVSDGQGRAARTSYRTLKNLGPASLVEARLQTGRTHQIRVHFLHLGFPVVGDAVYGKRQNKRLRDASGYAPPRQMLHAYQLTFRHPTTDKKMQFKADWPEDFRQAVNRLGGETTNGRE